MIHIAHNHYGLDTYTNQIEVIGSEQMIDAYSSVGLPIYYNHWSFGKQFVSTEQTYKRGQMGLAYEIVINSNPYALGFSMMRDIRRICEKATDEDRYWFPDIAGGDWLKVMDFAMRNFKDESFINQYLSPTLMRDLHLFSVLDDDREESIEITAIHEEAGYRRLRQSLADQYNPGSREPNLQVFNVNRRGDRSLTLRHYQYSRRPLASTYNEMLRHIRRLWGFTVRLESVDEHGHVSSVGECA